MDYKNKTEERLYNLMTTANRNEVSKTALCIMNSIQQLKTSNQLLGLASSLICLLDNYNMTASDVLGIAHNIVYSDADNEMMKDFKAIAQFMRDEWHIN